APDAPDPPRLGLFAGAPGFNSIATRGVLRRCCSVDFTSLGLLRPDAVPERSAIDGPIVAESAGSAK
ncbi:MAG TPA: hypothetical protein DEB06_05325, partial [Phycisphaerales bacterium]|nr:hypothetical protein [Phycisphaerales bacterium]